MKRKRTDLQEESSNVDDGSSIVRGGGGVPDHPNRPQPDPNNDGANTQFQRRRKVGRPPGSTNNSKSPASITRKPDPVLSPCIIEVADGADVLSSISEFCNNYPETCCVTILSATGAVSVVNLYQTGPITSSNLEFNGRFVILSLAATFITPIPATKSQLLPTEPLNVTITVKDADGQIIGGIVAEPLIASGTVYITVTKFSRQTIVAKFSAPEWRKLPMEENIASWSQGVMWTTELDPQYAD